MKTQKKETRIDLYVIDDAGGRNPCYWEDGWVVGHWDLLPKRVFYECHTPPQPNQVVEYNPEYFVPTRDVDGIFEFAI